MNPHVVLVTLGPGGSILRYLLGHTESSVPWELDGRTVGPEIRCDAMDTRHDDRCLSVTAVEVESTERAGSGYVGGLATGHEMLCGRHFNLHRKGTALRLASETRSLLESPAAG